MAKLRSLRASAFTGLLGAASSFAADESLQIDAAPCADVIEIRAQKVPLRAVLERLAEALAFRFESPLDLAEPVTFGKRAPAETVLKQLLKDRNLVLHAAPAASCGGATIVNAVWVLPAGAAVPVSGQVRQSSEISPYQRGERPRGTRRSMSESEWQQMKEDYKAGRITADPETGLPVAIDGADEIVTP